MAKKPTRVKNTSRDPVTAYARQVLAGKIIAGPHVRDACRRHMEDLEKAPERGFFFDIEKVNRVLGFCRDVLRLNGGQYEGQPFEPLPWQCFVLGSIFGWVDGEGKRRYTSAYVEAGKGCGKSPMVGGVGLYGLLADGEQRPEIYAAATKKDQAAILFRDAVSMVRQSPAIESRVVLSGSRGNEWNIAYHKNNGFFRPISADNGQSGPRPHIALVDELHEHRTNAVKEMLVAGFKFREQPLMVMITNSGVGKNSVCGQEHDYAAQIAAGTQQNDHYFSYVCALDVGDDPFKDEKCWPKANPSLQYGLPGFGYIRKQVAEARGLPSKESIVRRLNFCQWDEAEAPWISSDVWFDCNPEPDFDESLLYGRRCWGGLDLSSVNDFTSLVVLFEPNDDDPWWRLKSWFWLPGDGLHAKADRDRVPYVAWRDAGHLTALPGKVVDKRAVAYQISEIAARYDFVDIGYDRWRIDDFRAMVDGEGLSFPPMVDFGQGYKDMAPAVDEFERLLIQGDIRHDGNPVLTWNAANAVVVSDPAGNRKITKERAIGRIDGIVAAVMAAGRAKTAAPEVAIPGIAIW